MVCLAVPAAEDPPHGGLMRTKVRKNPAFRSYPDSGFTYRNYGFAPVAFGPATAESVKMVVPSVIRLTVRIVKPLTFVS